MADEKSPEQLMLERMDAIQDNVKKLQSSVRLNGLRDKLEDIDTRVKGLRSSVEELRKQGYVYGKGMEEKAKACLVQWDGMRPRVILEIERQQPVLVKELQPLESEFAAIRGRSPLTVKSVVEKLESQVETLESKVDAVVSNVEGMFDDLETETSKFKSELDNISKMLAAFNAAAAAGSFRLLPTEGALMAVKATFSRDAKMEKEDPEGWLFLTDQRLLFEQNEEVATKKVLFFTTEKQKVQKLLFEVPIALVETVQANKKGLFGHEDHLAFTFKSGAPMYQAWLHLDGQDCNLWQTQIGRACSGDFRAERAVEIDQAEVEKVKAAPTQCPNCGAPINQVVLRGMDSITCEYCKHVMRL